MNAMLLKPVWPVCIQLASRVEGTRLGQNLAVADACSHSMRSPLMCTHTLPSHAHPPLTCTHPLLTCTHSPHMHHPPFTSTHPPFTCTHPSLTCTNTHPLNSQIVDSNINIPIHTLEWSAHSNTH